MSKFLKQYLLVFLLLLICLLLEGALSIFLIPLSFANHVSMVFQLSSTMLVLMTFYLKKLPMLFWTVFIGLLYDVYYGYMLSFYAIPIVLTIYLLKNANIKYKQSFLVDLVTLMLSLTVLNTAQYFMALLLGTAPYTFLQFIIYKGMPTVLFNTVLGMLLYFPFKKLFIWIDK